MNKKEKEFHRYLAQLIKLTKSGELILKEKHWNPYNEADYTLFKGNDHFDIHLNTFKWDGFDKSILYTYRANIKLNYEWQPCLADTGSISKKALDDIKTICSNVFESIFKERQQKATLDNRILADKILNIN